MSVLGEVFYLSSLVPSPYPWSQMKHQGHSVECILILVPSVSILAHDNSTTSKEPSRF